MEITKVFELCGGKENWSKLYSSLSDHILNFVKENNLGSSEKTYDILKVLTDEVVDDIGESWYRYYLGKK